MENMVIVRSSPSGVWFGELVAVDGNKVTLNNARKVWSWTGAASCAGLAVTGPTGGKITAKVEKAVIFDVCEILNATQASCVAFNDIAPWTGR